MSALTILIMRHAEKPNEAWPGPGLDASGKQDENRLSSADGCARAPGQPSSELASRPPNPKPLVIYAADPAGLEDGEPSQRPFETIKPLTGPV